MQQIDSQKFFRTLNRMAIRFGLGLGLLALQFSCASQAPTIAHTHIGHAITGFQGTPGDKGLFVVAEDRGLEAQTYMTELLASSDPGRSGQALDALLTTLVGENYGLKRSVHEAANHLEFAAQSIDCLLYTSDAADE